MSIKLLLFKRAANKASLKTLYVEMRSVDNSIVKVYKRDFLQIYTEVTRNKYLRRLAESLTLSICTFAEANNLSGDLATRLEIQAISKGQPRFSLKERAWACSFCQNTAELELRSSACLRKLLNEDYTSRFSKKEFGSTNLIT